MGVAGGTIERSCYSPHYVNTERDYERDYQATLPQGRTAADGCKPRHGRDDRKRERSFSGLRLLINFNSEFTKKILNIKAILICTISPVTGADKVICPVYYVQLLAPTRLSKSPARPARIELRVA